MSKKILFLLTLVTLFFAKPSVSHAICGPYDIPKAKCSITNGVQCDALSTRGVTACCNPPDQSGCKATGPTSCVVSACVSNNECSSDYSGSAGAAGSFDCYTGCRLDTSSDPVCTNTTPSGGGSTPTTGGIVPADIGWIHAPTFRGWIYGDEPFLEGLTSLILTYGIVLAGLYFFVRLLIGGFTMLTSVGDPGKIENGKQNLIHAFIGLIIVVSAFFIMQIISKLLGIRLV